GGSLIHDGVPRVRGGLPGGGRTTACRGLSFFWATRAVLSRERPAVSRSVHLAQPPVTCYTAAATGGTRQDGGLGRPWSAVPTAYRGRGSFPHFTAPKGVSRSNREMRKWSGHNRLQVQSLRRDSVFHAAPQPVKHGIALGLCRLAL